MKHRIILLSTLVLVSSSFVMAQDDDMYFSPKRAKKEKNVSKIEIITDSEALKEHVLVLPTADTDTNYPERDVDEYNRRSRSSRSFADTLADVARSTDSVQFSTRQAISYELSSQNLYDLGYSEGYRQGFDDGEDMDYYYGVRLARFHGRHFYDPWYWGNLSHVYDPWYWNTWYYDPWYRPYYYGGWCSVGWGVGHWGTYWSPYWHGWHVPMPPHHSHPNFGAGHGPRVSTSRNRDYGRPRIVDRSTRIGEYGRNTSRGDRNDAVVRNSGQRQQRTIDRSNRASERANYRNNSRADRSIVNRSTNRGTSRNENRTVERSSTRSSYRNSGTSSSFLRNSGSRSGGGAVRSSAGNRGGRGR